MGLVCQRLLVGLGSVSIGRVLAQHVQALGFDLLNHWPCAQRVETEGSGVQGESELHKICLQKQMCARSYLGVILDHNLLCGDDGDFVFLL